MAQRDIKDTLDRLGDSLVRGFQVVALFVIGGTIVLVRRQTTTSG
jgi:hypothetical protein